MTWVQIVLQSFLGFAAIITAGLAVVFYRETRRQKVAEATRTEKEGKRTEAETTEIANKAAQINETRERERELWWARQFADLRDEFESERALSLERFHRLNALERYIDALMHYVRTLVRRLRVLGEDVEDPPTPPNGSPVRSKSSG